MPNNDPRLSKTPYATRYLQRKWEHADYFRNSQIKAIEIVVAPKFLELLDSLENSYYGPKDANGKFIPNRGWRNNESIPWNGLDKYPNPEDSKKRYDRLHGAIHEARLIAIHEKNVADSYPYDRDTYDRVPPETGVSPVKEAQAYLRNLRDNHPTEWNAFRSWLDTNSFTCDIDGNI